MTRYRHTRGQTSAPAPGANPWRAIGWILLGCMIAIGVASCVACVGVAGTVAAIATDGR